MFIRRIIAIWLVLLAAPLALAADITNPQTDASQLTSGTLAAARGGAGTINGALKGNGSGVVSQAACADLSNAATSCSTAPQIPFMFSCTGASFSGTATYNVAVGYCGTSGNEGSASPASYTLQHLFVQTSGSPGAGTYTMTLFKGGSITALTCQLTGGNTTCTDNTHSVSVVQGDLLRVQFVAAGGANNSGTLIASVYGTQ